MRIYKVSLKRSEHELRVLDLPAWEIPVLQVVHGPDKVVIGEPRTIERDYPDAATEYDRLGRRYKTHLESGDLFVAKVYGSQIESLAAAINREIEAEGRAAEDAALAEDMAKAEAQRKEDELRAKIRAEILAEQGQTPPEGAATPANVTKTAPKPKVQPQALAQ